MPIEGTSSVILDVNALCKIEDMLIARQQSKIGVEKSPGSDVFMFPNYRYEI